MVDDPLVVCESDAVADGDDEAVGDAESDCDSLKLDDSELVVDGDKDNVVDALPVVDSDVEAESVWLIVDEAEYDDVRDAVEVGVGVGGGVMVDVTVGV